MAKSGKKFVRNEHTVKDSTGKANPIERDTSAEAEEFSPGREQASPLRVQDTRPEAAADPGLRPATMRVTRKSDDKSVGPVVINADDFDPEEHTAVDKDGKAIKDEKESAAAVKSAKSRRIAMSVDPEEDEDEEDDDDATSKSKKSSRTRVAVKDDEDDDDKPAKVTNPTGKSIDTKEPETGKAQGAE